MTKRLFLLLVLLLLPLRAGAENCNFSTSGSWLSATSYTGVDDCTLDATDDIFINVGVIATIPTGAVVTQSGGTEDVTIDLGGTLRIEGGGKLEYSDDLIVNGTLQAHGNFRQFGVAAPVAQTEVTATNDTLWLGGTIVQCPGATTDAEDCPSADGGDVSVLRLDYRASVWDQAATEGAGFGENFIDEAIGEVDAGPDGDVIVWYDPNPVLKQPPVDEGYFYEVVATDDVADVMSIDVSVDQGTLDQSGYPLARRRMMPCTLDADVNAGARFIEVDQQCILTDGMKNGHMMRFESGGAFEEVSVIITRSFNNVAGCVNGPCDRFFLAMPHEVFRDQSDADSDEVLVDYGWKTGETMLVIQPARLEGLNDASEILLSGEFDGRGYVLKNYSRFVVSGNGAVFTENSFGWLIDPTGAQSVAFGILNTVTDNPTMKLGPYFSMTGGPSSLPNDNVHSISSDAPHTLEAEMVTMRHAGDDFFVLGPGAIGSTIIIDRWRAQFASANGVSQECFAFAPTDLSPLTVNASDLECKDGIRGGSVLGMNTNMEAANGNSGVINSVLAVGNEGGIGLGNQSHQAAANDGVVVFDLMMLGNSNANSPTTVKVLPLIADRFVVAYNDGTNAADGWMNNGGDIRIKNGIVTGNFGTTRSALQNFHGDIENVAFYDNSTTLANGEFMRYTIDPLRPVNLTRVLVSEPTFDHYIQTVGGPGVPLFTLDGVAYANNPLSGPVMNTPGETQFMNIANQCFWNNALDLADSEEDDLPGRINLPPNFTNPTVLAGRYDVPKGGTWDARGCSIHTGPQAPGICKWQTFMAWGNLEPFCASDLDGLGGGGGGGGGRPRATPN